MQNFRSISQKLRGYFARIQTDMTKSIHFGTLIINLKNGSVCKKKVEFFPSFDQPNFGLKKSGVKG